jgi:uncharacterized protein DUF4360
MDYLTGNTLGAVSYLPCSGNVALNLNTQVRLFNEGGSSSTQGQITNDSTDGKIKFIFGFQWRRC